MRWILVVGMMMIAGPAFADEVPVPTEGGDVTEAPDPAPAPDAGGGYSNPDGHWYSADGHIQFDPGHTESWYAERNEGWFGWCGCTTPPPDSVAWAPDAGTGSQKAAPGSKNGTGGNGGGHDR